MKHQINRSGHNNLNHSSASSLPLEPMEPRRLLSAAVEHGVLSIEGTRRADTIVLTMDTPKTLRVRVGDVESTFLKKSFSKIRINAGQGEDLVTIGSDATPITCPTTVTGGDGADTLVGGAGSDSLSGGAGADLITGAGGNDKINGDNGADDLHGGDGRDSLSGGRGDDQLHDDAGRDSAYGNAGTELIYFHDDVMQFRDQAKKEQKFAEPLFQIPKNAQQQLVINHVPLDLAGGGHIPGGLINVGGSTLVVAGSVLDQWSGSGLAVSNVSVPHFDLPGNSLLGGTLHVNSGSQTINLIGGSGSVLKLGTVTGGITLNAGTIQLSNNAPGTGQFNPGGASLTFNNGTIISPVNPGGMNFTPNNPGGPIFNPTKPGSGILSPITPGTSVPNEPADTTDTTNPGDAPSENQTTTEDTQSTPTEETPTNQDTTSQTPTDETDPNTGASTNPDSDQGNTPAEDSTDPAIDATEPNVLQ